MSIGVSFTLDPANASDVQFVQSILAVLAQALFQKTQLDRIEQKLDAAALQEQHDMAQLDDELTSLTTTVASNTTVIASGAAMISGFSAQLAAAIAAAQAAGATPAQLSAVTDLQTALDANNATLTAAIASNTPVATEIPPAQAQALARKIRG